MNRGLPPSRANVLRPALLAALGVVILAAAAGIVLHERSAPAVPSETASQAAAEPNRQASGPATAAGSGVATSAGSAAATAAGSPAGIAAGAGAAAAPGSTAANTAGLPAGTTPASAAAPTATASVQTPVAKPSFDVVRINPRGGAVMAGRAAPGSKVILYDAGKPIGEVQADQNGDWVFTPSTPLPPGSRELTLAEQSPDGTETRGDRSVVLAVPSPGPGPGSAPGTPALAVLTGPNAAPSVLTGPASESGTRLAVAAMESDGRGEVRFSGTAPPGAAVRLYVDNRAVGGAIASQQGKWSLSARNDLAAGSHRLRLDQVAPDGKVAARLEQSFARAQMAAMRPPPGQIEIRPGQNLWVIARATYGQGIRYLVIFQANRTQIRDPNLIYPGQVFALPAASSAPAMPASSSTSR